MHPITVILMILIAVFALWLLRREGLLRGKLSVVVSVLLLAAAFYLRLSVMDHRTADYNWFLSVWVQHFRDHGGFAGLGVPIGNYNVMYLYFLAFFSYLPMPDLHLIKLLSILFDVILAYYVMLTVGLFAEGDFRKKAAFFLALFLPTVFLNGAYWGQCDGIYTAFAVMSFYYVMRGRPVLGMVTLAVAMAFKLQVVFIFPLYLVFLVTKKIRLRHLPVFPLTYVLTILPAVFFGRPFMDTLLFYFTQASPDGRLLHYNAPSVFAAVAALRGTNYDPGLARMGIVVTFLFVVLVYVLVFRRRKRGELGEADFLVLALLFVVGVPFLLPQMHDRYFFMADVFAVILGLSRLRWLPAILLTQFASLLGYHAYLVQYALVPHMYFGAIALLVLTAALLLAFPRRKHSVF